METLEEYSRMVAVTIHEALRIQIGNRYPEITTDELDRITLDIIDRLARLRGYGVRRECNPQSDEDD